MAQEANELENTAEEFDAEKETTKQSPHMVCSVLSTFQIVFLSHKRILFLFLFLYQPHSHSHGSSFS